MSRILKTQDRATRGLVETSGFRRVLALHCHRKIGKSLPNNQRQRRTCYELCHILYPVSAAHTSIFRMDSNSTSYRIITQGSCKLCPEHVNLNPVHFFLLAQKVENKLMFETQPVSGFYNKLEVNKMFDGSASATLQGYLAQKKSPPRRNLQ